MIWRIFGLSLAFGALAFTLALGFAAMLIAGLAAIIDWLERIEKKL
jgi:hypothetical protein